MSKPESGAILDPDLARPTRAALVIDVPNGVDSSNGISVNRSLRIAWDTGTVPDLDRARYQRSGYLFGCNCLGSDVRIAA